jgi:Sulfotransferase family
MEPIFVGGCGRSGTTLLAALLAGHERVVAPPESQFFLEAIAASRRAGTDDVAAFAARAGKSWRYRLWDLPAGLPAELARERTEPAAVMAALAAAYAQRIGRAGADRWIDHTPMNIGFAPTLFAEFEAAPMVHIVRDPRAVVASVLPLDWGPASARAGARWWLSVIAMGLAAEAAYPGRIVRVRYEDLVRDPGGSLEAICPLLGLEFEPAMAGTGRVSLPAYTHGQHALVGSAPDPARIDAWRARLSARDVAVIEAEVRDVPAMLGYELDGEPPAIAASSSPGEFLAVAVRTAKQRWRHRSRVKRALAQPGGKGR